MKKIKKFLPIAAALSPLMAMGQVTGQTDLGTGFLKIVTDIGSLVNLVLPVLFGLGVVAFLWGAVKYITSAGDEEKRKEGRSYMVWSLIFLAIVLALFGVVNLITGVFGVDTGGTIETPNVSIPGTE